MEMKKTAQRDENLIAWDKAPHCGKKEKKIGIGEKKIGELSEPRGSLGRGKGGGAWRHAFDGADSPSSN